MRYAFFMNTVDFVIHCSLGSFFSSGSKLNIETEFSSPRYEMKVVGDSLGNDSAVRLLHPSMKPRVKNARNSSFAVPISPFTRG